MAEQKNTVTDRHSDDPRRYGHIYVMAVASLIVVLGIWSMWQMNAPYHPGVFDDTVIEDPTATRFDGTLLD